MILQLQQLHGTE